MAAPWISSATFTLAQNGRFCEVASTPAEAPAVSEATTRSSAAGGLASDSGGFAFVGHNLHTEGGWVGGGGVIINRVRRGGGREGSRAGTLKEVEREERVGEAGARDGGGRWNRCDIEIKTRK